MPATLEAPRMRVLMLSFELGRHVSGGIARIVNGVTEALRHHVDVDVYLVRFDVKRLGLAGSLHRCDARAWCRLVEELPGCPWRGCLAVLERERYDVLHILAVHPSLESLLDGIRRERPAQKIVYSIHSLVMHEVGIRRNPASSIRCERRLLTAATVVHVCNHATQELFERAYPDLASARPTHTIPNGIGESDLVPRDPAFRERLLQKLGARRRFTVVCLSRWAHGKGLEHFVAAAERLLEAGHDFQFVLAGRKWISWEKDWLLYVLKIQRLARRLGDRLLVLGWLSAAERNTLFELADCCVMASELEYFPYAVLEPATAGLPLVSADIPCVRELFPDGEECLYFPSGESAEMASRIVATAEHPSTARERAVRAQRTLAAICDWGVIAQRYEAMYADAIRSPAPAP